MPAVECLLTYRHTIVYLRSCVASKYLRLLFSPPLSPFLHASREQQYKTITKSHGRILLRASNYLTTILHLPFCHRHPLPRRRLRTSNNAFPNSRREGDEAFKNSQAAKPAILTTSWHGAASCLARSHDGLTPSSCIHSSITGRHVAHTRLEDPQGCGKTTHYSPKRPRTGAAAAPNV